MTLGLNGKKLSASLQADTSDFEHGIGKAIKLVGGFESSVNSTGKAVLKAFGAAAVASGAVALKVGKALYTLAEETAPLMNVKNAFEAVAESVGTSGDAVLAAFDAASRGILTHEDAMLSFNKASMLVSQEFATQLPEAVEYLTKVSGATGQDMGGLLDSLVTGVGRMSPAILDNLGIQVSLAEAQAEGAKMFGVEAAALTKSQQQQAMMKVVLRKLADNTEAMPDFSDSMVSLQTTLKNTKDEIGLALVPALGKLYRALNPLAAKILPIAVELFQKYVVPAIDKGVEFIIPVVQVVGELLDVFSQDVNANPFEALVVALQNTGLKKASKAVRDFIDSIKPAVDTITDTAKVVWEWLKAHDALGTILTTLKVAALNSLLGAIVGLVVTVGPIIYGVLHLIMVVSTVRKLFERLFPDLEAADVFGWFKERVPLIVEGIKQVVRNALEAIRSFWEEHKAAVLGAVKAFGSMLQAIYERVGTIIKGAVSLFQSEEESSWSKWADTIEPIVSLLWGVLETLFDVGLKNLAALFGVFAAVFKGDWQEAWDGVQNIFSNTVDGLGSIASTIWTSLGTVWNQASGAIERVGDKITAIYEAVRVVLAETLLGTINTVVGWLASALKALSDLTGIDLGWLESHSPPPMANWFNDIAAAGRIANLEFGGIKIAVDRLAISTRADSIAWTRPGALDESTHRDVTLAAPWGLTNDEVVRWAAGVAYALQPTAVRYH